MSESKKGSRKSTSKIKPVGSFLNRKPQSPSRAIVQNGKESLKNRSKVVDIEPESQVKPLRNCRSLD